jgi:hypothetical protein
MKPCVEAVLLVLSSPQPGIFLAHVGPIFLFIGLDQLLVEVSGISIGQLHDCIHAGCLQQIRIFRAYTLDAEKIGVIHPLQDKCFKWLTKIGHENGQK